MFRALLKLLILVVVVVAAGAFFLGWWGSGRIGDPDRSAAVETADDAAAKAREKTAAAGDRAAQAAEQAKDKTARAAEIAKDRTAEAAKIAREKTTEAQKALAEGGLTAKIKAKMALDDYVKARDLNVDTVGSVVTVSGYVHSEKEKERALQLARETAGVTQVIDKVQIKR